MITLIDSGIGAWFVYLQLRKLGFQGTVEIYMDAQHFPYGDKHSDWLIDRALLFLSQREITGSLVFACNTLSLHLPSEVRKGVISIDPQWYLTPESLVLATVASAKILSTIHRPDLIIALPELASLIEHGKLAPARDLVNKKLFGNTRTVVLACTHYSPLTFLLESTLPNIHVVDTAALLAARCANQLPSDNGMGVKVYHYDPASLEQILSLYPANEPVYLEEWHD